VDNSGRDGTADILVSEQQLASIIEYDLEYHFPSFANRGLGRDLATLRAGVWISSTTQKILDHLQVLFTNGSQERSATLTLAHNVQSRITLKAVIRYLTVLTRNSAVNGCTERLFRIAYVGTGVKEKNSNVRIVNRRSCTELSTPSG
jgi:hypothetical protein